MLSGCSLFRPRFKVGECLFRYENKVWELKKDEKPILMVKIQDVKDGKYLMNEWLYKDSGDSIREEKTTVLDTSAYYKKIDDCTDGLQQLPSWVESFQYSYDQD
jgi:hypothetical protein